MKISVITLVNINNYGSLLQAYATQKTLEELGHEVEFVNFVSSNGNIAVEANSACDKRHMQKGVKRSAYKLAWMTNQLMQTRPFSAFRKKHLNIGHRYANQQELMENPPEADVYLSGSDMLWNSKLNRGHNEQQFYLNYAPKGFKKVAFSSSIGEEDLPIEEIDFMLPLLKQYSAISMRENSGVEIVRSMGLNATKVLDPTLMLASKDWSRLFPEKVTKKGYIFVYFLHQHAEELLVAREYAKEKGLRMVRLAFNPFKKAQDDEIVYMPSVEECVSLFANADYVITDSFHGTCFSLNFKRKFYVVRPPRFMDRLSDILKLADAERRVFQGKTVPKVAGELNYEKFENELLLSRNNTLDFLNAALS